MCVYIYIYIYMCVCVCVCVFTCGTHACVYYTRMCMSDMILCVHVAFSLMHTGMHASTSPVVRPGLWHTTVVVGASAVINTGSD